MLLEERNSRQVLAKNLPEFPLPDIDLSGVQPESFHCLMDLLCNQVLSDVMSYDFEINLRLWWSLWDIFLKRFKQTVKADEDGVFVIVAGSANKEAVIVEPRAKLVAILLAANVFESLERHHKAVKFYENLSLFIDHGMLFNRLCHKEIAKEAHFICKESYWLRHKLGWGLGAPDGRIETRFGFGTLNEVCTGVYLHSLKI